MSAAALKWIALVLMLVDHIGEFFGGITPVWFRWLGRLSAPLFLFCLAKGLEKTRSRPRYLRRLWIGSVVMGCSSFVLSLLFPMAPVPVSNNIFSTMAVIAAMVWIFESYGQSSARRDNLPKPDMALGIFAAVQTLSGLACAFAEQWGKPWVRLINGLVPNLVYCEGSIEVVILGLIFFYLGKSRRKLCLGYGIYCAAQFLSSVIMAMEYGRMSYLVLYFYQWMMIGSLPLMLCYNGQRGRQNGRVFYLFYPLHIWALYLLSNLLA